MKPVAMLIRVCLLACLLACVAPCLAQSLMSRASPDDIVAVANNWLRLGKEMGWGWQGVPDFAVNSAQEIKAEGGHVGYCFQISDGGYIVVPAYRELPPITAYSSSSRFNVSQEGGFVALIKEVLTRKISLVQTCLAYKAVPSQWVSIHDQIIRDREAWQAYSSPYSVFTDFIESENLRLSPSRSHRLYNLSEGDTLVHTSWHQRAPYNNFCPMGDGGRCVVGCTATATAQIMAYWRWPENGSGSFTYLWDGDQSCGSSSPSQDLSATYSDLYAWGSMLDHYSGEETQTQRDAVAELCYEVGVVHHMDYGVCGSGAGFQMDAFVEHFLYSPSIDEENRSDYGTAEQWFDMLRTELDSLRPIWYAIGDSACHNFCHAIVCDGWRVAGTNQVHMNYGWDDSHTAWYVLDDLFCGGNACDPSVEFAIRRIYPDFTIFDRSIVSAEYFFDTDPGLGQGMPISVFSNDEVTLTRAIGVPALSSGLHHIYLRYCDSRGVWSAVEGRNLYVTPAVPAGDQMLASAEYYLDSDPGVGQGQSIDFPDATEVTITQAISPFVASTGFHRLFLRFRTTGDLWSAVEGRSLYVTPDSPDSLFIAGGEVFIDSLGEYGQGLAFIADDGAFDESVENMYRNYPVSALTLGNHYVLARVLDNRGFWSNVVRDSFTVGTPAEVRLVALSNDSTGQSVRLAWTTFPGTVEYHVHYDSVLTGQFVSFVTVAGEDTSLIVESQFLPNNGRRFYYVVAILPTRAATLPRETPQADPKGVSKSHRD